MHGEPSKLGMLQLYPVCAYPVLGRQINLIHLPFLVYFHTGLLRPLSQALL